MDLVAIFLTASLTVFGGILVFVSGQVISRFYLEPVDNLLQVIGEVSYSLVYYANIYSNPGYGSKENMCETATALRQLASQLSAKANAVKGYKFFVKYKYIPTHGNLFKASKELIGLSNSIRSGDPIHNYEMGKRIKEYLNITTAD